jgi:broad specificity phosphatase PhoE
VGPRGKLKYSGAVKRALLLLALAATLAVATPAAAQEAVFVVRHAERADASKDPSLSEAGIARAARLATMLKDAGITGIYTTDLRRTIQTAAPLASAAGLTPVALPAADLDALLARIHAAGPHDRLLVVGHSNTVPAILRALGAPPIAIAETEYDNLFVVVPQAEGAPHVLRLRY